MRVLRIKYGAHDKSVMHGHPNGVAVFLTDAHFRFTLPDGKAEEPKSKAGRSTRFELLREAWRRYFESRYPVDTPTKAELTAIRKRRVAFKRGDYTLKHLHNELDSVAVTRPAQKISKNFLAESRFASFRSPSEKTSRIDAILRDLLPVA